MKTIQKTKFPLLALLLGISLAFTTSAFKASRTTLYWFQVNTSTGAVSTYLGNEEPGGDCASDDDQNPTCSVAFEESDIPDPNSPSSPISNVNSDPSSLIDDRKHLVE